MPQLKKIACEEIGTCTGNSFASHKPKIRNSTYLKKGYLSHDKNEKVIQKSVNCQSYWVMINLFLNDVVFEVTEVRYMPDARILKS